MKAVLVRYGELALKGKNRADFESKLKSNIISSLSLRPATGHPRVRRISGRLVIYTENQGGVMQQLRRVFGIVSLSAAEELPLDMDGIKGECLKQAQQESFSTFRISVSRLQKNLRPSPELEKDIGAFIADETGRKVKLKSPGLEIFVEIAERAYVFTEKQKCVGGLPAGIEGRALALIEGHNSVLAGLLAMRRGCELVPVAYPDTECLESFKELLARYGCERKVKIVKDIKEAGDVAERKGARAVITGQQLETLRSIEGDGVALPVLRPLVGISPLMAEKILLIGNS